jgi:hypothetical protein
MTRKKDEEESSEIPGGKAAERLREFISQRFPGETALPDEETTNPDEPKSKDSDEQREQTAAKKREGENCPPED